MQASLAQMNMKMEKELQASITTTTAKLHGQFSSPASKQPNRKHNKIKG